MTGIGQVIGTPAHSLDEDSSFALNEDVAKRGAEAERYTAAELVALLPQGAWVLNDLSLWRGSAANIDHVVVAGRTLVLIDTKWWAPGFYWTLNGVTRRGLERVPHCDKDLMSRAQTSIVGRLTKRGIRIDTIVSLVAVWGRAGSKHHLRFYRPVGSTAVVGDRLIATVRDVIPSGQPDPAIITALRPLVKAP